MCGLQVTDSLCDMVNNLWSVQMFAVFRPFLAHRGGVSLEGCRTDRQLLFPAAVRPHWDRCHVEAPPGTYQLGQLKTALSYRATRLEIPFLPQLHDLHRPYSLHFSSDNMALRTQPVYVPCRGVSRS